MPRRASRLPLLAGGCLVVLAAGQAAALPPLTLLTMGKTATLRDRPGTRRDLAVFRFGKSQALAELASPLCDAPSWIQVAAYPVATNRVEAQPAEAPGAALPCANWRRVPGGYRYHDAAGSVLGVRDVLYAHRGVRIRLQGGDYTGIRGPVGYVEVWLTVGDKRYLGRFHNFRANGPKRMVSVRPSPPAARGEGYFWDTLWGDADQQEVAISCLETAVARDAKDGRSYFLLAMMHLYRFGQATTDFTQASDFAKAELRAAEDAFVQAVPLLWDAKRHRGDTRVPGFAAANAYLAGVVFDDAASRARAIEALDAAVALNPVFNAFDLFGVVPHVVAPDDPLYTERVLPVLDGALSGGNLGCIATQPEVCGNDGMAPRNTEGALTLFGDLFAKGGRPATGPGTQSDVERAEMWYGTANLLGTTWRYRSLLDVRLGHADERRLSYLDADPANDAPIVGTGAEACAICHNR